MNKIWKLQKYVEEGETIAPQFKDKKFYYISQFSMYLYLIQILSSIPALYNRNMNIVWATYVNLNFLTATFKKVKRYR